MPENVSPELRRFINEHVGSIAQLELLLLLGGDPAKTIDAEEASRVFYVTVDAARAFLETMAADGLLAAEPGGKYRFAPRHAEWARARHPHPGSPRWAPAVASAPCSRRK